jgi:hypothetical protein
MPRSHEKLVGALLALFALVLAGCEATRYYSGPQEKNLQVTSSLSGTRAAMGVHRLDNCTTQYEGVVDLDRPVVEVGLPTGRPTVLVFEFYSSGLLRGNTSIKKEAMVLPRPGYRYEARAVYKDSLYDVDVREIDSRTGAARELDIRRRC